MYTITDVIRRKVEEHRRIRPWVQLLRQRMSVVSLSRSLESLCVLPRNLKTRQHHIHYR